MAHAPKKLNPNKKIFPQIHAEYQKAGMNQDTRRARDAAHIWLRGHIKSITNHDPKMLYKDKDNIIHNIKQLKPGQMIFFGYFPKHAATLKYYDIFPLVFPLNLYKDGFLGLNLHYLPPTYRQKLLHALKSHTNNQKFDETTRLRMNYNLLKSFEKFSLAKPCIKRYLSNFITKNPINIVASDWDHAIYLPYEAFKKTHRPNKENPASVREQSKHGVWRKSGKVFREQEEEEN